MKRLNRKGFTLVELLAVIVILAIVVGITLVTVLPTLKDSRQEAFEVTAQTAADYLEKQYQLTLVGLSGSTLTGSVPTGESDTDAVAIGESNFKSAGLKPGNYNLTTSKWYINEKTDRACVILYPNASGEYHDATGPAKSAGC